MADLDTGDTTQLSVAAPDTYANRVGQIESGLDPYAWTSGSKYRGLYQLGPDEEKQWGVTDWRDPSQQRHALDGIYNRNYKYFQDKMGRAPSEAESYLMHQQGPAGLTALLNNPDKSAADVVGQWGHGLQKISGNLPSPLHGVDPSTLTSRDFVNGWTNFYNRNNNAPITNAQMRSTNSGVLGPWKMANQDQSPMAQATQQMQQDPDAYGNWADRLGDAGQRAAAWLASIYHPEALGVLGTLDRNRIANRPVWGVTGERIDPTTGASVKQYGWINAQNQTINGQPAPGGSPGPAQTGPDFGQLAQSIISAKQANPNATQDDLIKQLPQSMQAEVAAVLDGRGSVMSLPQRSPQRTAVLELAHTIDPNFDEGVWKQRSEYLNKYGNAGLGQAGGQINAGNKALEHLGHLSDAVVNYDPSTGGGWTLGARIMNGIRGQSTSEAGKQNNIDAAAMALADEMNKLYSGTGQGVNQRERMAQLFDHTKSKTELADAIENARGMIKEQLGTLAGQRDAVYGGRNMEAKMPVFRSADQEAKITNNVAKLRGAGQPTPSGPVAGGRYTWSPQGGLQPIQ